MSRKKENSLAYHKAQQILRLQGPVSRPQEDPCNKDFASHAKQKNLSLLKAPQIHPLRDEWELKQCHLLPTEHTTCLNDTTLIFVNNKVQWDVMMEKLAQASTISFDLEGSDKDSFLGE